MTLGTLISPRVKTEAALGEREPISTPGTIRVSPGRSVFRRTNRVSPATWDRLRPKATVPTAKATPPARARVCRPFSKSNTFRLGGNPLSPNRRRKRCEAQLPTGTVPSTSGSVVVSGAVEQVREASGRLRVEEDRSSPTR
jgi:hypothetical protein